MGIKPQTAARRADKEQVVTAIIVDQPLPHVSLLRTTVIRIQFIPSVQQSGCSYLGLYGVINKEIKLWI